MNSDKTISAADGLILSVMIFVLALVTLIINNDINKLEDSNKAQATRIDSLIDCQFRCLKYQNLQGEALIKAGTFLSEYADAKWLEWQEIYVDSAGGQ